MQKFEIICTRIIYSIIYIYIYIYILHVMYIALNFKQLLQTRQVDFRNSAFCLKVKGVTEFNISTDKIWSET